MARSRRYALAMSALGWLSAIGLPGIAAPQGSPKFPAKGTVMIGNGPLPLFVHYLDGSGQRVKLSLRDLSYRLPDLALSNELRALAARPCRAGDQVRIADSRLSGQTSGTDAAGVGRFVWLLSGTYSSDGRTWRFEGAAGAKDDLYNFNIARDGDRTIWAEVSTRLGSKFDGKQFWIQITGSIPVGAAGLCSLDAQGRAIV